MQFSLEKYLGSYCIHHLEFLGGISKHSKFQFQHLQQSLYKETKDHYSFSHVITLNVQLKEWVHLNNIHTTYSIFHRNDTPKIILCLF